MGGCRLEIFSSEWVGQIGDLYQLVGGADWRSLLGGRAGLCISGGGKGFIWKKEKMYYFWQC